MKNAKKWLKANWQLTKSVTKNIVQFLEAVCLALCAGFTLQKNLHQDGFWGHVFLFASCVIAVLAAWLLLKHFAGQSSSVKDEV